MSQKIYFFFLLQNASSLFIGKKKLKRLLFSTQCSRHFAFSSYVMAFSPTCVVLGESSTQQLIKLIDGFINNNMKDELILRVERTKSYALFRRNKWVKLLEMKFFLSLSSQQINFLLIEFFTLVDPI